jgi:hypothetical protein
MMVAVPHANGSERNICAASNSGMTSEKQRCLDEVIKYGDNYLAYFHIQDGLKHYFPSTGGVISYSTIKGLIGLFGLSPKTFVLGDPVVLKGFLERSLAEFHKVIGEAVYLQITRATAEYLSSKGYYVNVLGTDAQIDLTSYSILDQFLAGLKKRTIRQKHIHGQRNWICVEERPFAMLGDRRSGKYRIHGWQQKLSITESLHSFLLLRYLMTNLMYESFSALRRMVPCWVMSFLLPGSKRVKYMVMCQT